MTALDYLARTGNNKIQIASDFDKWQNLLSWAYLESLMLVLVQCIQDQSDDIEKRLDAVDSEYLFYDRMKNIHTQLPYNYRDLVTLIYKEAVSLPIEQAIFICKGMEEKLKASICRD